MLWFYLKYTLKSFRSNQLITLSSLLSIVLGVLSSFLIYQWVHNELTMDRFHKNAEHIYLVTQKDSPTSDFRPAQPSLFFKFDYSKYPLIKKKLTLTQFYENDIKLMSNNMEYIAEGMEVDSTFFDFFDFELSVGDPEHILDDPEHIIITTSLSKKIFGNKDPLGLPIELKSDDVAASYKVAGILADIPSNSSLEFDFLIQYSSRWAKMGAEMILVDQAFEASSFNEKFTWKGWAGNDREITLSTLPFTSIYFGHHFEKLFHTKFGNLDNVHTLIAIGIIILAISLLNFVNLQTTALFSQASLMGVKKVNGASKLNLIMQMLFDRMVYMLVSVTMVYISYHLIYPYYTQFLGYEIHHQVIWDLAVICSSVFIFVLISALFPLVQLSRIDVYSALHGHLSGVGSSLAGKTLTTIQYASTIVLMIASVFVFRQLEFMLNKDLGITAENIVNVKLLDRILDTKTYNYYMQLTEEEASALYQVHVEKERSTHAYVLDQLVSNPDVMFVSKAEMPIGSEANPMSWKLVGENTDYTSENTMICDPNYAEILDLNIVEGRFFETHDRSRQNIVVINETAKRLWNIGDIEGQYLANQTWGGEKKPWQIIGVVKDYHYEHLTHKIKPLMLLYFKDYEDPFLIKLQKGRVKEGIAFLKNLQAEINPNKLFSYTVLEDKIKAQYKKEKRLSQVYLFFTLLALFISSIGLFTFALYETRKRTKEIGLRKVNGASIREVVRMLNYTFLRWVAVAFVIGCPVGYYLMDRWLETFANKINLDWWVFALVGLVTVALALLTVSWQSWRVARQNPVESLRYE